jgi:hypothetical protein
MIFRVVIQIIYKIKISLYFKNQVVSNKHKKNTNRFCKFVSNNYIHTHYENLYWKRPRRTRL